MAGIITPRARALGAKLRQARDRAGLGQRELGRQIGINPSVLSRYESGERTPSPEDVAVILTALKVPNSERERILDDLARGTDGGPWLSVGVPEQPAYLAAMLEFESTATKITDVGVSLCPGLTQTADYAKAIISGGGVPADQVATRVAVRLGRREVLHRRKPKPVELEVLLGETALQAAIGGREVMVDQLRHMIELAKLPNVEFRVIPTRVGYHPGLVGPFTLYEFSAATPIASVETSRSGLFLGEPEDIEVFRNAVDLVRGLALDPEASIQMAVREIDRWEKA